ncbi:MAG: hypothetical protein GXY03_01280 [Solirubrobacterales bacterium]|nr:hypothetical protein [Solirubrobacterales bacterium]
MAGRVLRALALGAAAVALAIGCGDSGGDETVPTAAGTAADPDLDAFPRPEPGQSPAALAQAAGARPAGLDLLTTVHPAGHSRLAFTLERDGRRVTGPTAVYAVPAADRDEVAGPLPAPGTELRTATGHEATVYEVAAVDLHHRGRYDLIALTRQGGDLLAARATIDAVPPRRAAGPAVGEPVPLPAPLAAQARGRPAALVLGGDCRGRDCFDLAAALRQATLTLGDRVAILHPQRAVERRLRRRLRLSPAPWLLTVDGDGLLAARLEGAVAPATAERALQAAIVRGG